MTEAPADRIPFCSLPLQQVFEDYLSLVLTGTSDPTIAKTRFEAMLDQVYMAINAKSDRNRIQVLTGLFVGAFYRRPRLKELDESRFNESDRRALREALRIIPTIGG